MRISNTIKRNSIILLLSILILNCNDTAEAVEPIKYEVNKDVIMYSSSSGSDNFAITGIWKGDIVQFNNDIESSQIDGLTRINIVNSDGEIGFVDSECLDLIGSERLPELLTSRQWVLSYYEDILKSQKRETFYDFEPYWRNKFVPEPNPMQAYEWWDQFREWNLITKLSISNNHLMFSMMNEAGGLTRLASKSYDSQDGSFVITVSAMYPNEVKFGFMKKISEKKDYKLIFELDGDYLTIYLDKKSKKLAEFIAVDDIFIQSVYDVAQENSIDISKINWPKRASKK